MIVTGQQPAVGGGPLYTLIKVAHAVALGRTRGEPALFWCASEDHDLGEADHADLILRDGTIRRYAGDLGGGRASLRFRPASIWWDGLISHCRLHLGPGLGEEFLRTQAPHADEGMGAWLCRLLRVLFPTLEAVEGHTLRSRWGDALGRALSQWPAAELAGLRQHLLAEGAVDAFGALDEAPLFADEPTGRTALSAAEARARLAAGGLEQLSPGAALRPILQQAALPCSVYVGGPGELAYHRFIMPLYAALGVAQPELLPRCSLTVVPGWCARGCRALGGTAAHPELLADPQPSDDTHCLEAFDALLNSLRGAPDLAGNVRRLEAERAHLHRRLVKRAARRDGLPAAGALRAYLLPRGHRQERTMSLFQALWEHGPGLAPLLVEAAASCQPGEHRVVEL